MHEIYRIIADPPVFEYRFLPVDGYHESLPPGLM
jgi:hypothetical protein